MTKWRETVERNALWLALGAIALAGAVIAVGIQVAPETFYDHFWWEDIWGPLVVDAHQCRGSTDAACVGLGPPGVRAVDGYTITSELTYGLVLAVMLYGIYVGLFRRYQIRADGSYVLALLPWILLGPVGRVLEDADAFCRTGTHCDPGPLAFVFISPVIYIAIAVGVLAAMLIGLEVERRGRLRMVPAALGVMFLAYSYVALFHEAWFTALPPLWFVALSVLAAFGFFVARVRAGHATMNGAVFALGMPFALGVLFLVGRWLFAGAWSTAAWSGAYYLEAGAWILTIALLTAALVWALSRWLVAYGVERRWAALASKVPEKLDGRLGYAGLGALVVAFLMTGILPAFSGLTRYSRDGTLVPILASLAGLLLLVAAFIHVGRAAHARPGVLLLFAAGINVALVFAHVLDGVSTWVALEDPFGFGLPTYSEKHPFSELLLRYWDGFLYPFTKLVMVLGVAWVLDRETKADKPDDANMVGLVKMAIFALGFGPGLRDLLRLTMGV